MRMRYSYPRHRYPFLMHSAERLPATCAPSFPLTPAHHRIVASLKTGARVAFDTARGRALVYRIRHGMEELMELTVRTLALLVRKGILVVSERTDQWVHYAYAAPRQAP